ncbi:hypothetical protein GDO81_004945 [Engystomops pustulosus]|uniref:Uncharacterized protein n=1 Tax=Engystomops pustulosus TaxID=76066 RepID=A0AAV7CJL7_ENGPU|nr:hypothetical protein GDO81_004945 [Engystomops pustulosus]
MRCLCISDVFYVFLYLYNTLEFLNICSHNNIDVHPSGVCNFYTIFPSSPCVILSMSCVMVTALGLQFLLWCPFISSLFIRT